MKTLSLNLAPAKLRGIESRGMLLAADDGEHIILLEAPSSKPGDAVTIEGVEKRPIPDLKIEEFLTIPLVVKNQKATCNDCALKTATEEISVNAKDGAKIR